jgi:hypothetical protein
MVRPRPARLFGIARSSRAPRRTLIFDPLSVLCALARHDVHFVLIGGVAALAHGVPIVTEALDICHENTPDNLGRLVVALGSVGGVPVGGSSRLDARMLAAADVIRLRTDFGGLDIFHAPTGSDGYNDLSRNAARVDLDDFAVGVAALDDLIRMKGASCASKDRVILEILGALRDEIEGRPPV